MMRIPRPLQPGDRIAIVSPASAIDPALIDQASETLRSLGYEPVVFPHARGRAGSYSGTIEDRFDDMKSALADDSIAAILCSRGGYGAVHLLQALDPIVANERPRWLIGFSDISALHALWHKHGIVSIHASMCKQLALGPDTEATRALFDILRGNKQSLSWENRTTAPSRPGVATGRLAGGNMAVLDALASTPYNDMLPGDILVIEDIAEPIYKIERMLYRLKLGGVLGRLGGLIVGQFTEYKPDRNDTDMETMISRMVAEYDYPVAYGAPVGHIGSDNMPLLLGASATLAVTPDLATI